MSDITTEAMLVALDLLEQHQDGLPECMFILELEAIRTALTGYADMAGRLAKAEQERDALKEEVERLKKENTQMRNSTAKEVICCRCGKETMFYSIAPYGSLDDGEAICAECLDNPDQSLWKVRAEKAEAALAEAGPLIEAVMASDLKANGPAAREPGKAWCSGKSLKAILKAALAYRAKREGK